jgi:hypothetical protein
VKASPPRKRAGQGGGPRRVAGQILDVAGAAQLLGVSEKAIRARVARGLLPYRRWGGRVVFLADELAEYLRRLPGVTLDEAVRNGAQRVGEPA